MNGLHLIADLYRCGASAAALTEREALETLCVTQCREAGLTPLGSCFYQFRDESGAAAGVTGTVVLAESHLTIHTWPEAGGVTLDVYVCNFSRDNGDRARVVYRAVIDALRPAQIVAHEVVRGRLPEKAAAAGPLPLPAGEGVIFEQLNEDAGYFTRGGKLIEKGRSRYQEYEVWETPQFGRLFRLDGCFMTSERDEFHYHENLIQVPCIAHPAPARALILGGGDGGSAEELLKQPTIVKIVIAELDEKVIEIARRHLQAVHRGALDDPRVELRIGDGFRYVMEKAPAAAARFDLIVLDLTDPVGPAEALYSEDFFRGCRALLAPGGAISLHIGAPVFQPDRLRTLVARLRQVFAIVRPYFLYVPLYGTLWGFATASDTLDPAALHAEEVDRRLAERRIGALQHYNGAVHCAQFALPNHLRALLG